ncbi:MAG: hypothetical protein P4L40_11320 [Terracidiphilus sp.]|nr:hypothetical protein [Terracidiphilus sp.]
MCACKSPTLACSHVGIFCCLCVCVQVRDLVFVSARAYSREEILRMETTMLNTLKFNLTVPTAFIFLQRGLKVIDADAKMTNLAQYYVERSLQEYAMLRHVPSLVAASGIFLAMKTLQAPRRATWVRSARARVCVCVCVCVRVCVCVCVCE